MVMVSPGTSSPEIKKKDPRSNFQTQLPPNPNPGSDTLAPGAELLGAGLAARLPAGAVVPSTCCTWILREELAVPLYHFFKPSNDLCQLSRHEMKISLLAEREDLILGVLPF